MDFAVVIFTTLRHVVTIITIIIFYQIINRLLSVHMPLYLEIVSVQTN